MRKKLAELMLIAPAAIMLAALTVHAQPPDTLWTRTYGGPAQEYGASIQQTEDGGYVFTATTYSFGAGGSDVWLVKLDAAGDTLWTKTFGAVGYEEGKCVQQTADGGYILAGWSDSFGIMGDIYLIRTDAGGNAVWTHIYGGSGCDLGYSVLQASDGGFIVGGMTSSYGAGNNDGYLVKTNAWGGMIWTKTYGGPNQDECRCVQGTSDGGYVLVGQTYSFGAGGDVFLIKTDAQGDTIWTRAIGGNFEDAGRYVQQTDDGGFIIVGYTNPTGTQPWDIYLIKTDAEGDTIWTKTFGGSGSEYGLCVQQTADGGFIVSGSSASYGMGSYDIYLIRTDAGGDTLWTKTFGGSGCDDGYCVQQVDDGGYIVLGDIWPGGVGSDSWVIRLAATSEPMIELSTDLLYFDSVQVWQLAQLPLTIYNVGNANLVIYEISSTNPYFTTDFDSAQGLVVPGDSLELTVFFCPSDPILYAGILHIENNDTLAEVVLMGESIVGVLPESASNFPKSYAIKKPYPNPFNATTILGFQLPVASHVSIEVMDVFGRVVAAPVHGWLPAGAHQAAFDPKGAGGSDLASGIYLVRLQAGNFVGLQKLILLK